MRKGFVYFVLLLVFIGGCQQINYETNGPFVIATSSPAGPEEYRNMYSSNVAVTNDGEVTLYTEAKDGLEIGDDAPVFETKISKNEVAKLKALIKRNKFWKLKDDISDDDSVDGGFLYITVNASDESKRVGGLNPYDPNFLELHDYIFDLISNEDFGNWREEIQRHIYEMNPD